MAKEYIVTINVTIDANDAEHAQEIANDIHIYHSLRRGGDELDPSVINVVEIENVKNQ